jgi:hypothetical protein
MPRSGDEVLRAALERPTGRDHMEDLRELVTHGEQSGADADLVICWPPGEPLL